MAAWVAAWSGCGERFASIGPPWGGPQPVQKRRLSPPGPALGCWARVTGGWKAFDSSTGFRLPDNSVLSPDASLVALDRWQVLSAEQRRGARLGWLLIPAERAVEIWEPMAEIPAPPQRIEAASRLDADPEFPGLAVDLEEIWRAKAGLPSPDQGVRMGAP